MTATGLREQQHLQRYRYRAVSRAGHVSNGAVLAFSGRDVVRDLDREGWTVLEVAVSRVGGWTARPVSLVDLATVLESVAALTAAGVPVDRALASTEDLVPKSLREGIQAARALIREGMDVAGALRALPSVFPESVIGTIEAGERGGSLSAACVAAAEHLRYEAELRSEVRSALSYPFVVLSAGLATVMVLIWVVVPRFALILGDLGAQLPPLTATLVWLSERVTKLAPVALPTALVGLPILLAWSRNPTVRLRLHRLLLSVPVVGALRAEFAAARVCRALAITLGSGLPILHAVDAASSATADLELRERLLRVRARLARGAGLWEACKEERAMSPLALQLIGLGEGNGSLVPALARASDMCGLKARRRLKEGVRFIEPILILFLGGLVAFVAAALLSAVYSVRPVG